MSRPWCRRSLFRIKSLLFGEIIVGNIYGFVYISLLE
jgi:hypothetical protein